MAASPGVRRLTGGQPIEIPDPLARRGSQKGIVCRLWARVRARVNAGCHLLCGFSDSKTGSEEGSPDRRSVEVGT